MFHVLACSNRQQTQSEKVKKWLSKMVRTNIYINIFYTNYQKRRVNLSYFCLNSQVKLYFSYIWRKNSWCHQISLKVLENEFWDVQFYCLKVSLLYIDLDSVSNMDMQLVKDPLHIAVSKLIRVILEITHCFLS